MPSMHLRSFAACVLLGVLLGTCTSDEGVFKDDTVLSPASSTGAVFDMASMEAATASRQDDVRAESLLALTEWSDSEETAAELLGLASKGSVVAAHGLALVYLFGDRGLEMDVPAAVDLFRRAADVGHPPSQTFLGLLYGGGIGVPQDQALAMTYLSFASMQGDPLANVALGYRHLHGMGAPVACEAAANYYRKAATEVVAEIKDSAFNPEYSLERLTNHVEADDMLSAAGNEVVDHYRSSALSGNTNSQVTMGFLYLRGSYGVGIDYAQAYDFFELAAEAGDATAMAALGQMYAHGWGVRASNTSAVQWFEKGAKLGAASAFNGLGKAYLTGAGVVVNKTRAIENFNLAAERGSTDAQYNIGVLLMEGEAVKQDFGKALQHLMLAGHQGHALAIFKLAVMHNAGWGTARSCLTAAQLFKNVAERGWWGRMLEEAHAAYVEEDLPRALVKYQVCAELGSEVAQSNVAYLLDRGLCPPYRLDGQSPAMEETTDGPHAAWAHAALRLFEQSAEQGNTASRLKLGDYYYYGKHTGGEPAYHKAAAHYRKAADAASAQAMFNLGFMHEAGLGLPKDFHLAKRMYDQAAATSQEAALPVSLALVKLALHYVYFHYIGDFEVLGMRWDTLLICLFSGAVVVLLALRPR